MKNPVAVVFNGDGFVVTSDVLPKSMVTVEVGSNPAPVTVTEVPLGPEDGSSIITGSKKLQTVNEFDALLDARVSLTV